MLSRLMTRKFRPGDLVFVTVAKSGMTLTVPNHKTTVREYYHSTGSSADKYNKSLGYATALVKSIIKNQLEQAETYTLQIGLCEYNCKSILAERYLIKVWAKRNQTGNAHHRDLKTTVVSTSATLNFIGTRYDSTPLIAQPVEGRWLPFQMVQVYQIYCVRDSEESAKKKTSKLFLNKTHIKRNIDYIIISLAQP